MCFLSFCPKDNDRPLGDAKNHGNKSLIESQRTTAWEQYAPEHITGMMEITIWLQLLICGIAQRERGTFLKTC